MQEQFIIDVDQMHIDIQNAKGKMTFKQLADELDVTTMGLRKLKESAPKAVSILMKYEEITGKQMSEIINKR